MTSHKSQLLGVQYNVQVDFDIHRINLKLIIICYSIIITIIMLQTPSRKPILKIRIK
jgi:hypothetical protein